jgi:hypothetical protein
MPLYATADKSPETEGTTDLVVRITVSHLPPESPRLVATVVAAYMLFGFTMARTVVSELPTKQETSLLTLE